MTVHIENATKSFAYVRVMPLLGNEPIEETAKGKTFELGVRVIISTMPHAPQDGDLVGNRMLQPGENVALTDEYEFAEFKFKDDDPDINAFCVEDMDTEDDIGYRIVPNGTHAAPPKHERH